VSVCSAVSIYKVVVAEHITHSHDTCWSVTLHIPTPPGAGYKNRSL
jgi:hypothetical protein